MVSRFATARLAVVSKIQIIAAQKAQHIQGFLRSIAHGGEGGIRTLGTRVRTTVFETVPFDRSGTSP